MVLAVVVSGWNSSRRGWDLSGDNLGYYIGCKSTEEKNLRTENTKYISLLSRFVPIRLPALAPSACAPPATPLAPTLVGNCWNCFSPLRCGAPTEATPQQRQRQQHRGEQRHGNGNGKGILVTTVWRSSIAASFALFLLHSYILLDSCE